MSFGWSFGDLVSAINLAVQVYNSYHSSCGEFHELTQAIDMFQYTLGEAGKALKPRILDIQQRKGLQLLGRQTVELLTELDNFVKKNRDPNTGKMLTARRLIWQPGPAAKLQGRIQSLTTSWHTYYTFIVGAQDTRVIPEAVRNLAQAQSALVARKEAGVQEVPRAATLPYDTGWEQTLKNSEADSTPMGWKTTSPKGTEAEDVFNLHDRTPFDEYFSQSSTLVSQSSTHMARVPTGSSGASTSSSGRKPSFMDVRPKAAPLAFNPARVKRTESSSSARIETKDTETKRRASTPASILKLRPKLVLPGSSAPSMGQQRLPFSAGFTSRSSPPRAPSNTESAMSSKMRLSRSHTGVISR